MKKAVWGVGILFVVAGFARAQTVEADEPWANKLFKSNGGSVSHDFGVVPRGAQLKHNFKMKNIWKVPVQLTDIRVSCGCVTWKPDKTLLQPNEEGNFNINMDARLFSGSKTVTVYVTLGPEFVSTAMLRVSAVARQDVVFNPGTVNFGVVQRGETPAQVLDVEYSGNLDWQISEVIKNAAAPFKVAVEELYREKPSRFRAGRVGYRFNVTLKPDAGAGPFKEELILKTNDPASPTLTAAIEGTVQASLTVAPASIRVSALKKGDTKTQSVIVSGSRPFRITAIEGQGDGISADVPDQAAASHIITIRCRPAQPGHISKRLVLRTDMEGQSATVGVEVDATP